MKTKSEEKALQYMRVSIETLGFVDITSTDFGNVSIPYSRWVLTVDSCSGSGLDTVFGITSARILYGWVLDMPATRVLNQFGSSWTCGSIVHLRYFNEKQ